MRLTFSCWIWVGAITCGVFGSSSATFARQTSSECANSVQDWQWSFTIVPEPSSGLPNEDITFTALGSGMVRMAEGYNQKLCMTS